MKRWLLVMGAVLVLAGCSEGDTSSESESGEVSEVEASELDTQASAGTYYLDETHPAIVDIWNEFDDLLKEMTDSVADIDYEEEYVLAKLMDMIIGHKELSVQIDALPVEGLDADQEELEKFKMNAKLANDNRILYGETLIDGLGRRGISQEALDSARQYLELANVYSLESMENVVQYEEKRGF